MSEFYNHTEVEEKWRKAWDEAGLYESDVDWARPKHYALTMLPYPSGDLHIGHWYIMTPSDARARYMRMRGYNVLFPMGFDAFGLPAENAAVQRNIHPWKWTYDHIERMRAQMKTMGTMIDWRREAVSCTPEYYRWTQWFFSKLLQGDLAYRGEALVNWSPTLQTVLANEQVIDGKDERTGQPVVQKLMEQWFFRITKYADELLSFEGMDWPEPIKAMQTNWIGRSEGARIRFGTDSGDEIEVFTTRPDTLFGATFMVLSPEHPLVEVLTTDEQRGAVDEYREYAAGRSELERSDLSKEKTGVFTGGHAINPANDEKIPVWIADYVLMSYGTGAIMAVPGQDQRDWEFAEKFGLGIVRTVQPPDDFEGDAYLGDGPAINSGFLNGLHIDDAKKATIDWLEDECSGDRAIQYPPSRLVDQPSAVLGEPDSYRVPRRRDRRVAVRRRSSGRTARGGRLCADRSQPAHLLRGLSQHDRFARRAGHPGDGHDGHVHVLVVVSAEIHESPLRGRAVGSAGGGLLAAG